MDTKGAFCLFLFAVLLSVTECFPTGAPAGACANVAPNPAAVGGHGADPQSSAVPYALTGLPPSGNYTPGMSYTRECPNPRTIAYLTPNCRSQTCLYQCTNTLDQYPALVRRTKHSISSFQLTKAYMAGIVLMLIHCATLSALKVTPFAVIT